MSTNEHSLSLNRAETNMSEYPLLPTYAPRAAPKPKDFGAALANMQGDFGFGAPVVPTMEPRTSKKSKSSFPPAYSKHTAPKPNLSAQFSGCSTGQGFAGAGDPPSRFFTPPTKSTSKPSKFSFFRKSSSSSSESSSSPPRAPMMATPSHATAL